MQFQSSPPTSQILHFPFSASVGAAADNKKGTCSPVDVDVCRATASWIARTWSLLFPPLNPAGLAAPCKPIQVKS